MWHIIDTLKIIAVKIVNSKTKLKALLAYHQNQGHILRIKRGLYAVAAPGSSASSFSVDPYLVAAKLTQDAILSHHTALAFYGRTYSMASRFIYSTSSKTKPLNFQDCQYQGVLFPKKLRDTDTTELLVKQEERLGMRILVTSFERTLVDLLERPDLGFGWEEIWRSLENVEYFDIEKVIQYALQLDNITTIAKVGFYLEQHKEQLMVEEHYLKTLSEHLPKQPHYMDKNRELPVQLLNRWNLIVPKFILEKSWEEPF